MKRRLFLSSSVSTGLAATAFATPAFAQGFPNKPVRMIVPFPAGGATDVLARSLSIKLGEKLGQNVVVENRPGAGGTIGSQAVAQAAPDGYTILLATSSTHSIGPVINPKIPYDAQADFTALGQVASSPNIVLVPQSSPAKTMREFIEYARKNPGKLNYASSGNGTIVHLTSELFKAQSNTFIVHIPYRGTALAIPDLISGKVDVLFDSLVSGLPHVKDGKLRGLAVTSEKRTPLAADLPTVADVLPGFESVTWFGLYGPKAMPADVVQKLNASLNAALAESEVKERFSRLGAEAVSTTPAAFASLAQNERAKWKRIIEQRKIVVE
ncbi:tripartite tricarboxylate transporter substrate binding protein [Variovorax sp. PCZ-1]|uniref:Bug family tripartite tricarboxylate transporter substrate binding protein n=1 Tax=Variovorax sp. PCZ-1 TaxID=2835533 RepID=UPI001BCF0149|nr:tripartite tricarboxylate transporter substrate binding protein [Variovorax sp. PCZ-1]MBS7806519.1 tripartite tricarboxylate transporter substrate binding protein [Variovorax sp. PCZ-1]